MGKSTIYIAENKDADQLCSNFSDSTVPLLRKFQAFSHFQRLYRPACVGPGWKP